MGRTNEYVLPYTKKSEGGMELPSSCGRLVTNKSEEDVMHPLRTALASCLPLNRQRSDVSGAMSCLRLSQDRLLGIQSASRFILLF